MLPPAPRIGTTYGQEISLRRRLTAFAIAVLINALLLLMLLFMSPSLPGTKNGDGRLLTFSVNDNKNDQDKAASKPRAQQAQAAASRSVAPPAPKPTVEPPVIPPTPTQPNMIILSRDDFAASDISKLPSRGQGTATADAGGGGGQGNDSALAGGSGPNGEPLYAAEWYREPTDAELRFYLPKTGIPRGAWAEIACQTVARFHVDNCVALRDAPPGARLASAIREAAWQFLVRPPRVGGKTMVGTWVRIRISFTREAGDKPED